MRGLLHLVQGDVAHSWENASRDQSMKFDSEINNSLQVGLLNWPGTQLQKLHTRRQHFAANQLPPGPHRPPPPPLTSLHRRTWLACAPPPRRRPHRGVRDMLETSPRVLVWLKVSIKEQGQELNRVIINNATEIISLTPCVMVCLNMFIIIYIV